ncbi:MAG: acetaldehyde dehydrogenase (acetylating) [Pseudomonadota bacterium]
MSKVKAAIIGPGNIGTDLLIKIEQTSSTIEAAAMIGIDPGSDGLARAKSMGKQVSSNGVEGLIDLPGFDEIEVIFDATSAGAHANHDRMLNPFGKKIIDLTPAALGPYIVPSVNLAKNKGQSNVNMVTCGGQATIPIVAAINDVSPVHYSEIVASISSKSAGPGTRANIDEFTETTSRAIEVVGGAKRGKAVIILNPAEPPLIMRDTVYCLCDPAEEDTIRAAVEDRVAEVQSYVPGYRLKQSVQFERFSDNNPVFIPDMDQAIPGLKVSVFLEVEGAAHYLPAYAGNLDIMTSAALQTAHELVKK